MNKRVVRILLWSVLALAAPIPIFVAGAGSVPLVKLMLLFGLCLAVMVFESTLGALPLLSLVIGVQVLVHVLVLWLISWLFSFMAKSAPAVSHSWMLSWLLGRFVRDRLRVHVPSD